MSHWMLLPAIEISKMVWISAVHVVNKVAEALHGKSSGRLSFNQRWKISIVKVPMYGLRAVHERSRKSWSTVLTAFERSRATRKVLALGFFCSLGPLLFFRCGGLKVGQWSCFPKASGFLGLSSGRIVLLLSGVDRSVDDFLSQIISGIRWLDLSLAYDHVVYEQLVTYAHFHYRSSNIEPWNLFFSTNTLSETKLEESERKTNIQINSNQNDKNALVSRKSSETSSMFKTLDTK